MTAAEFVSLWEKISGAGLATLLGLILFGSWKQIWVWGFQLKAVERDRDFWRASALKGTGLAERLADLVAPKVDG